jgi:hypothetical protein
MAMVRLVIASLALLIFLSCKSPNKQLELELRRSLKNFVGSVDELHQEGLNISVYFPDVADPKLHVQELRLAYMDDLDKNKPLTFDPQGVVLSRYLGMVAHNYKVLAIEPMDNRDHRMRISFNFSWDQMMRQAHFEQGTKVWIPAKPWGTSYEIIIGEGAPAPREQLLYCELVIVFRKTNHEGFWQVRTCEVDPASLKYETSIETDF